MGTDSPGRRRGRWRCIRESRLEGELGRRMHHRRTRHRWKDRSRDRTQMGRARNPAPLLASQPPSGGGTQTREAHGSAVAAPRERPARTPSALY
eukprot:scaffold6021_cov117-Isochrysis_galbana.AAC.20